MTFGAQAQATVKDKKNPATGLPYTPNRADPSVITAGLRGLNSIKTPTTQTSFVSSLNRTGLGKGPYSQAPGVFKWPTNPQHSIITGSPVYKTPPFGSPKPSVITGPRDPSGTPLPVPDWGKPPTRPGPGMPKPKRDPYPSLLTPTPRPAP